LQNITGFMVGSQVRERRYCPHRLRYHGCCHGSGARHHHHRGSFGAATTVQSGRFAALVDVAERAHQSWRRPGVGVLATVKRDG
jgi:hypothetical protein